jgi:hypothetical protein
MFLTGVEVHHMIKAWLTIYIGWAVRSNYSDVDENSLFIDCSGKKILGGWIWAKTNRNIGLKSVVGCF